MDRTDLYWLPPPSDWELGLKQFAVENRERVWDALIDLSKVRLSSVDTIRLDRCRAQAIEAAPAALQIQSVRVAILSSSTVDHLLPAIRVAGLRRSLWIETFAPQYGQYAVETLDRSSGLHRFAPNVVVFAQDSRHLMRGIEEGCDLKGCLEQRSAEICNLWDVVRREFGCLTIQHVPMPVFPPLMGENEHLLPWSKATALYHLTSRLREMAETEGVALLSLDVCVARDGLAAWHDPALWHRAKQEIHPTAAPLYGDLVARVVAAAQGRSFKCLVLDLDNTLWGGVVGDDGLEGIKLGQGSAVGEAFADFQRYAKDLGRRGIILAVCSKNDEVNAYEVFDQHPEMVLKRSDIACFMANWSDKASNLRVIAAQLNIGLDSLVFVDDNPAERAMVRQELPMVAVPELPEDPTLFGATIADSGYFESLRVSQEDLDRVSLYRSNLKRAKSAAAASDISTYLHNLNMRAQWSRFDRLSQTRIVQLINKTNQFNLTTYRVTDEQIDGLISDCRALTLQVRLLDTFGDNGIVAIVIGVAEGDAMYLRNWLMSCRVFGRGLEDETLNMIACEAQRLGARRLIGEYRPSAKNSIVSEHYHRLGFTRIISDDGASKWTLSLEDWTPLTTFVESEQVGMPALPAV